MRPSQFGGTDERTAHGAAKWMVLLDGNNKEDGRTPRIRHTEGANSTMTASTSDFVCLSSSQLYVFIFFFIFIKQTTNNTLARMKLYPL